MIMSRLPFQGQYLTGQTLKPCRGRVFLLEDISKMLKVEPPPDPFECLCTHKNEPGKAETCPAGRAAVHF